LFALQVQLDVRFDLSLTFVDSVPILKLMFAIKEEIIYLFARLKCE